MVLIRVKKWVFEKNMKIKLLISDTEYIIEKVGVFTPKPLEVDTLKAGEVGFITANIKETSHKHGLAIQ